MTEVQASSPLDDDDGHLVDLVGAVLVDPELHTDTRMRLQREIADTLRWAHEQSYGPAGADAYEQRLAAHDRQVPKVLESVLTDPNIHTDMRMHLHREISRMLRDLELVP